MTAATALKACGVGRVIGGELPLSPEAAQRWRDGSTDAGAVPALCKRFGAEPDASVWLRYGRCALGAALDVCGVSASGRSAVLAPSYQCIATVKTLRSRTPRVGYYGLDARLRPSVATVRASARRARAVLTCVYFGSRAIEERLDDLARALRRLPQPPWIIEDRVMCAPDPRLLREAAARCDLTILSFRKHYPVPDGALLIAHSDRARQHLRALSEAKPHRGNGTADRAVVAKLAAKVMRHAWLRSVRLSDDPRRNGLAESRASEARIDQATTEAEADW